MNEGRERLRQVLSKKYMQYRNADGVHPEPPALEKILNRLLPISYNAGAIPQHVRVAQGQSDGLI